MPETTLADRTDKISFSPIRDVTAKVDEARRNGRKIWTFSAGRPDFDTPPHIKAAAQKAIEDGLVHYTPSIGIAELREAVCRRYALDYQLEIDPDNVIITSGSTEAIYIVYQGLLNQGDEVLMPQPMYVYYEGWALLAGGRPVTFPLLAADDFHLRSDDLKRHITKRTKALLLSSPHNPTGQVYSREELTGVARLAMENDFYVICDDVYDRFVYDGAGHFPIAGIPGMKERTFIIGSLSKTYGMDGWRVGYLIAPRDAVTDMLKLHQYTVNCCNTFVQVGAAAALSGPQDCVREMIAEFDRRRLLLMSRLDGLGIPYVRPAGTFYVFPSISQFGMSSGDFSDFLLREAGVAVVPGDAFGPGGAGFIRMAYCLPCQDLEQGMDAFAEAVGKL